MPTARPTDPVYNSGAVTFAPSPALGALGSTAGVLLAGFMLLL